MTFEKFIDEITIPVLARKMKVTTRTIYRWKTGDVMPKPEAMMRVIKLSEGRLTLQSVTEHYFKTNKGI